MKRIKKKKFIFISTAIVFIATIWLYYNYLIIFPITNTCMIGIIDSDLTISYENIEFTNNPLNSSEENFKTHGDLIMQFVNTYSPDTKVCYYSYGDNNTTENIIEGIKWLINHNVKYINISLSNKNKSQIFEEYINQVKDKCYIFCSFNNNLNTFDYPAMYNNTIGVGELNKAK